MDHTCELWDFLRDATEGKSAHVESHDERIAVHGDAAWVIYGLRFRADFGPLGTVDQGGRATEIWQRIDGAWSLVHFHCSNQVSGQMGGI